MIESDQLCGLCTHRAIQRDFSLLVDGLSIALAAGHLGVSGDVGLPSVGLGREAQQRPPRGRLES